MRPLITWRTGVFLLVVAGLLFGLYRWYVWIDENRPPAENEKPGQAEDSALEKS